MNIIARNKKAFFDYEILETLEAGICLLGSEVKALRKARVNLKDSFIKIIRSEAFLFGMHISYLETTNPYYKPNETRDRKLLLHKKQIDKLFGKVGLEGLSIVPLKIYFNQKNKAKVQIALVKGKNLYDKRQSIKKKILDREIAANLKNYNKGLS
ncbi:SsrA-binding protein SmpB [Helicobacter sp. 13S00477-4]|uniref:SsrA-binding protein SmpB n=1 Tax=Helicobacter sp. 13S00477-4 TaxID=1905759 RepID=UPI000BA6C483|nr:SsrA-binding protein SmpB [Helicobacter sp. 13S00477-4]PAF52558.1 SsrA-binding protein [Helicobacter sp. 13S00477-4]